ncbi:MAG: hypothetical protein R3B09_14670 [Nannocystaceae bacterium]
MTTSIVATAVAAAMIAPPVENEVIGGYYEGSEVREREPDDGDKQILIGSILAPLGALRAASGVGMLVAAQPGRCQDYYGKNASESTCSGLRIYSGIRIGLGGLMLATGAVLLSLGLVQRRRHREWKRRYGVAAAPGPLRGGVGFGVVLRF